MVRKGMVRMDSLGNKLAEARKRKGLTQEQLAMVLPVSRETIAKYETEQRKFQKDLYESIAHGVDDPEYYFATWTAATGYVSIPYFNGDYIDRHPTSMKYLVQGEMNEALKQLERVCWSKPIKMHNEQERENAKQVIHEILDAAALMINLVAVLCTEYKFSMKTIYKIWWSSIKTRRWKE